VPFGAVALTAYVPHNYPEGLEPGLEETSFYDPSNFCFPFGAHACVVEIDPETGAVKVARYLAVDDVGNVINPMIVDGMVHGGLAQGIGQAICEGAVYDAQSGQLLTGSMMDYAVPKADQLPLYDTARTETPTPVNPMGIKGAGETGTIAATPAVVNAVVDALSGLGVDHIEVMPLTPERVWQTAQSAKSRK
jgi:carbon-monoxide dehydrogenase large subunit